jgi:myo-inositol-1(or 4)-monophosphatase
MGRSDAEVAVAAAAAGAAIVRARFGTELIRYEKSADDFATNADIEAERAILAVLRAERPADAYRGEELGASGDDTAGRTWLVDPLCGTLNFAARTPLVAVNVALRGPVGVAVAACADPLANEIFWTDGRAAYERRDGVDRPLRPTAATRLVDVDLHDRPPNDPGRFRAAGLLGDPAFTAAFGPRILSTTLALAWVAAGRRAAYVTAGEVLESVHFAAGIALCRAAGCALTGLGGQPRDAGIDGLIAAADGGTGATLAGMISRHR